MKRSIYENVRKASPGVDNGYVWFIRNDGVVDSGWFDDWSSYGLSLRVLLAMIELQLHTFNQPALLELETNMSQIPTDTLLSRY